MPASRYKLLVLVLNRSFRQPVIIQQALFKAGSSFLAWADFDHTGHAYSAAV